MATLFLRFATAVAVWASLFAVPNVKGQEEVCPIYRIFDTENPSSSQYLAPDGCGCVDGMNDMHCRYCTSDAPCRAENPDHVCRSDLFWGPDDTYKSFSCDLTGSMETLLTGGKTSFYFNMTDGTGILSVYNTASINHFHAVDCEMSGCEFPIGGTGVECSNGICKCTEACIPFIRDMVEDTMSNKPVRVTVTEQEFSSLLSVDIEGAIVTIEALCNASACTLDPEPEVDESVSLKNEDTEWDASATFSLITLFILTGIFMVLSLCVCIPHLMSQRGQKNGTNDRTNSNKDGQEKDQEEELHRQGKQVLEFRHISRIVTLRSVAAKAYGQKEKKILHNISGKVESGSLTAVLGPSGSGKSSLLNVLAAIGHSRSRISGQILLNGKQQTKGYRNKVAYVQQDDSLYETLTVLECVEYSALLRLPKDMKWEEKQASVWKTLQELRLTDIAQNRIGSGGRDASVSGGERKRVSIGMELVAQPSVLVLDEPTSGLDSFAANKIINLLSELTSRNRIVLLSVHQPSMKSFMTFDQVLLLGAGRLLYSGKPSEVDDFFNQRGFPLPAMDTVADHMLEVVSDEANHAALAGSQGDATEMELQDNPVPSAEDGEDAIGTEIRDNPSERKPFSNEMIILFARTAKDILRNRELFFMQLALSIVLAVFAGLIFRDVSDNLAGFQNRMGAFYFSLSFFAFASFSSMDIFVRERHIFVRETGSKYFRSFSYFLAKTVLDMFVLRVIPVTIFTFIFYFMMGLRNSPEAFVIFWATIVLFNVCAGLLTICISIATPTVGQANLIAAVWFLIMLLFGGFLVNVESMEAWFSWLKYLSIFYYSFEILMTNELMGLFLAFDPTGAELEEELDVSGSVFLQTIGMDPNNQLRDLSCLCLLALGFATCAYLLLLLRVPPSAGRQFQRMENENKRLSHALSSLKSSDSKSEKTQSPHSVK